jgi:ABC-type polysaccharide/polyol phosphate export permease
VTSASALRSPLATGRDWRRYLTLWRRWVRRDFDARYRRSALSGAWAIAQPLAITGVYCFIFGAIFDQTGGDLPYLSFFLAGMVAFRPVASAISMTTSLSDNHSLLSHTSFPRELVPLSQVTSSSIELVSIVPALVVVGLVQGVGLHPTILLAPLVLAGILCTSAAVCVALSTAQVFVRDVQFVAGFGVQALFFASPISYQPEQVPEALRWVGALNPVAVYAEALRDVVLRGDLPNWALLGPHLLLAPIALALAVAHLRAVGHRIVDLA